MSSTVFGYSTVSMLGLVPSLVSAAIDAPRLSRTACAKRSEEDAMPLTVKNLSFCILDPFPKSYSEHAEFKGSKPLYKPTVLQMDHTNKMTTECECCRRVDVFPCFRQSVQLELT